MKTLIRHFLLSVVLIAVLRASFMGRDGEYPNAGLTLSGNVLTTSEATSAFGTVFRLNTDGSAFTNLHTFLNYFNDGALPWAGVALSGGTLFGTTRQGGTNGSGTVFSLSTNGEGFRTIQGFAPEATNYSRIICPDYTNSDGSMLFGTVVLSGNLLIGTAAEGGTNNQWLLPFFIIALGPVLAKAHYFAYTTNNGKIPLNGLAIVTNLLAAGGR